MPATCREFLHRKKIRENNWPELLKAGLGCQRSSAQVRGCLGVSGQSGNKAISAEHWTGTFVRLWRVCAYHGLPTSLSDSETDTAACPNYCQSCGCQPRWLENQVEHPSCSPLLDTPLASLPQALSRAGHLCPAPLLSKQEHPCAEHARRCAAALHRLASSLACRKSCSGWYTRL